MALKFFKCQFYLFLLFKIMEFPIFIACFESEDKNPNFYYDLCNVNESKTAYIIIQDILNHFHITEEKCFILTNWSN